MKSDPRAPARRRAARHPLSWRRPFLPPYVPPVLCLRCPRGAPRRPALRPARRPGRRPAPARPGNPDGPARQRAHLLCAPQRRAARARRTLSRTQRRVGARRRRPARAGSLYRAHAVQWHAALSEAGPRPFSRIHRDALWGRRERLHELRRDGLHAHRPHRLGAPVRPGLRCARRLGRRGPTRRRRDRPRAGRDRGRVARARCQRRRAVARAHHPRAPAGVALQPARAHRLARRDPPRALRGPAPLLPHLVPPGPDGPHRGGRRGRERRRAAHPHGLRRPAQPGYRARPAPAARARAAGHRIPRRDRPRVPRDLHRGDDARARDAHEDRR